jgi:hypothetical protein
MDHRRLHSVMLGALRVHHLQSPAAMQTFLRAAQQQHQRV